MVLAVSEGDEGDEGFHRESVAVEFKALCWGREILFEGEGSSKAGKEQIAKCSPISEVSENMAKKKKDIRSYDYTLGGLTLSSFLMWIWWSKFSK